MTRRRRKIVSSGASRSHATREFTLLPGGADVEPPPGGNGSEGRAPVPRPSHGRAVALLPDDAEGSVSGSECAVAGRSSYVHMDRFALADVRRAHRLTPVVASILDGFVRLVEWRPPHLWSGTLVEVAEFTGWSRNSINSGIDRLVAEGLIAVHEPFRQRRSGLVEVLIYDELVVPPEETKRSIKAANPLLNRSDRATDQPIIESTPGSKAVREGGCDARVLPTRDRPALGAYRKVTEAFPGAEEVS